MYQQAAAVDMAQKVVTETGTLTRALDDARDVRHDKAHALVDIYDAEVGIERREVVIRDLRVRLGHHAQQRALAHVGKAHQPHVREQLQLEHDVVALAGQTRLGKARHLTRRRREVLVAPAAAPAAAEHIRLGIGHVLDDLVCLRVADERPARDADHQILSGLAGLAAALAIHAVFGDIFALVAEVHQRGHVVVDENNDAAAVAAVAAVRAARRHIFFSVKGHRAVAAVSGADGDASLVDKAVCHLITSNLSELFYIISILPENGGRVKSQDVFKQPVVRPAGALVEHADGAAVDEAHARG